MAGQSGAILMGLANGLSAVPQQLNDLAFQQQARQQQLQAGTIANQMSALQLSQAQTAQQNEQQYQQDMLSAYQGGSSSQPSGGSAGGASAPQPAGGAQPANAPQSSPPGQNQSLPAPLRNNNPGALMGPNGQLMKFPTIQAGQQALINNLASYGNKGINTVQDIVNRWAPASAGNDTQSYIKDVAQRLGVAPNQPLDMQDPKVQQALARAISIHENGRAAVDNTAQNARAQQSQQPVQAAQQAAAQPSPADQIAARESAGVDTPIPVYQQAIQAQGQQIGMLQKVYNQAMQQGHPAVAQKVAAQIQTLQNQQLELQTKGLAIQKEANTETASLAAGVKDQSSYDNLRAQIKTNPAMQQAVAGLNLTGQYDLDKDKLQTLADRSVTLKDQSEIRIKAAELQLKQQAEQREQAKADQPKIATAQAQAQDAARQKAVAGKGLPFAPSIAATAPVGITPQQVQQAQKQVAVENAAYDKANAPAVQGAKAVRDQAAQAYVMLDKGGLSTGGPVNTAKDAAAPWALDAHQQEFNKLTNQLVQSMQLLAGANGGARSASTAAMYKNFAAAKPNIRLSETANKEIAHGLYVGAAAQAQMNNYLDEYRQANPDATVQSGVLAWRGYEQALGPTMVYDASQKAMVPNTAMVPTLEDGTPNPEYKDYHVYFANGGHW